MSGKMKVAFDLHDGASELRKELAQRIEELGYQMVSSTCEANIIIGLVCGCCDNFPDLIRSWYPGKKVVILRHGYNEIKLGRPDKHNTEYPRYDCEKDVLLAALNC